MQLFDALPQHIEDALTASIQRFGVLVPVAKDQHGETLDGNHRSRIADRLGVKYRVDVIQVGSDEERGEISRTLNADRRQLSEEQRRTIAAELRQQGHSERAIAGALGVSQPTVHRDLAQAEIDSPESISPTRVKRQGGGSYPSRRPTVIAAKNEREAERAQDALISLGDDAPSRVMDVKRAERLVRETAAEQRRAEPVEPVEVLDSVDIRHGDFRDVLADLSDVDVIITDPPYPREFVPLFGDLSALAAKVLRPGGILAVMTGQSWLPDYMAELGRYMRYRWTCAYVVSGPRNRVHAARVGTGWKPVLLFSRPGDEGHPFLLDDVFASGDDDKRHHHWGQSESGIAALVERLTQPGELVCDPFLGGGTTAVVCRDLGREFVGCDLDAAAVQTSRERVA